MSPAHSPTTLSKIFISYRRSESAAHAGRLSDQLTARFGSQIIFIDIESIEPGRDFVEAIESGVSSCQILLAVIGQQWLTCSDESGRRLDDPNDFVRLEIATALKRNIRVIPVLVQGAAMPRKQDLPDALAPLARRHAWEVRDIHWKEDAKKLIEKIAADITPKTEIRRGPNVIRNLSVILVVIAVIGLFALMSKLLDQSDSPKVEQSPTVAASPQPTTNPTASPIYHGFKSLHERFKDKLGNPQPPTEPEMVYQARHEHARIIWIDGKDEFYLLRDNNQLEIVPGVDVEDDTYYFDAENRKRTGAPEGKDPPRGTFAMLWVRDPETWKAKLGWRQWHCQYLKGTVHLQWFEHGLIIGDLRRMEEDYRAVVYVLLTDEHTWSREVPERPAPLCGKPATNAEELKKWLDIHPRR